MSTCEAAADARRGVLGQIMPSSPEVHEGTRQQKVHELRRQNINVHKFEDNQVHDPTEVNDSESKQMQSSESNPSFTY